MVRRLMLLIHTRVVPASINCLTYMAFITARRWSIIIPISTRSIVAKSDGVTVCMLWSMSARKPTLRSHSSRASGSLESAACHLVMLVAAGPSFKQHENWPGLFDFPYNRGAPLPFAA